MPRVIRFILLWCVLGAVGLPRGAGAQEWGEAPSIRQTGTVANLFATLDPSSPIDGARLELPPDWSVRGVHLLRYGTTPVPLTQDRTHRGDVLLTTDAPVEGPHELVLRVQLSERPGRHRWQLTPFVHPQARSAPDSSTQRRFLTQRRLTQTVELNAPARPDGANHAADLAQSTRPLRLRLPSRVSLGRDRSFTVEFWMRTEGLDQVLMSTWTGDEATAYPLEFVVDQSGRLRFYCGRAGRHQALRTTAPVADGHWHHAAVVYDADASQLRLLLDGTRVDSVRARALPGPSNNPPVALGGRRPGPTAPPDAPAPYTGRLDEVRFWPQAQSEARLRQLRTRPFPTSSASDAGPFRLSFDPASPDPFDWPEGARRVPATLSFRAPLRSLRAQTDGASVTLRWTANPVEDGAFIVERSRNGHAFSTVERLTPTASVPTEPPREMTYTDTDVPGQVVYYRVRQVANNAPERTTSTIKIGLGADTSATRPVTLIGNFPNPFRTSTTIAYRVETAKSLALSVWTVSGKRIATLADGMHDPGYYEEPLRAEDLPSGPYFVRLETPQGVQSHRMVLLK